MARLLPFFTKGIFKKPLLNDNRYGNDGEGLYWLDGPSESFNILLLFLFSYLSDKTVGT